MSHRHDAERNEARALLRPKPKRFHRRKRGGATIECELCGGRTKVKRTTRVGRSVLRQRQCESCGHRQRTRERRVDH